MPGMRGLRCSTDSPPQTPTTGNTGHRTVTVRHRLLPARATTPGPPDPIRRTITHPPLPTRHRPVAPEPSTRRRHPGACLSRVRETARTVLRGRRRSNAPSLPDQTGHAELPRHPRRALPADRQGQPVRHEALRCIPAAGGRDSKGGSLGLMTYLEPKGEGDSSMSGNQRPGPDAWDGALGDPHGMAKAGLLEPQSPAAAIYCDRNGI